MRASFPGRSAAARTLGPTRKCVRAPSELELRGAASRPPPALPAGRAVSEAGFPGAAEGRRARSAGREGGIERDPTVSGGTRAEHRPGLAASPRTTAAVA